jgi:hypothetical protein
MFDFHEGFNLLFWMSVKFGFSHEENHRLSVCEDRMLGRIFGPKAEKVTRVWRKLYNYKLHILCSSTNIMRESNQGGKDGRKCSRNYTRCMQNFVGNPKGNYLKTEA